VVRRVAHHHHPAELVAAATDSSAGAGGGAGAGGAIGVRTAPSRGTRLSVFLPRAEGQVVEALRPAAPLAVAGGTEVVLLVEDEPQVRALACRALERRGYAVLSVQDAESALRLADSGLDRVSILVTDLAMPGMDGRTLARCLRDRRPTLPVLFMSGFVAGASGELEAPLLGKPFTPDALVSRVRELLDAARPTARTGA
jgi:CheY-like chemotaxis protein